MVKAYIVDVDGTLYSQRKLRMILGIKIFLQLLFHPSRFKSIRTVWEYRKSREKYRSTKQSLEMQFNVVSEKMHVESEYVLDAVKYWMHVFPLNYLKRCAYTDFIDWLNLQGELGKMIYIYSDYSAKEKLEILGVRYDDIYTSDEIGYVKPDKRAMEYVINRIGESSDAICYIGDRDEVDGEAARSVGIQYIDIRSIRKHGKIKA